MLFLTGEEKRRSFPERRSEIGSEDLVKDPQCGTYVPARSAFKADVKGKTLYFCSEKCRDSYLAKNKNET